LGVSRQSLYPRSPIEPIEPGERDVVVRGPWRSPWPALINDLTEDEQGDADEADEGVDAVVVVQEDRADLERCLASRWRRSTICWSL
jgi:hypothetical protein